MINHPLQVEDASIYFQLTQKAVEQLSVLLEVSINDGFSKSDVSDFFKQQADYAIHIEKDYSSLKDEGRFNFYFELETNPAIHLAFQKKTLRLKTILKRDCFLIVAIESISRTFSQVNSRHFSLQIRLMMNQSQQPPLSETLLERLQSLVVAREQSKIVQQRLKSWEIYLDLLNKNAKDSELLLDYTSVIPLPNFSELHVTVPELSTHLSNRKISNFNAMLIPNKKNKTFEEEIGTVKRVVSKKNLIILELKEEYVEWMQMNKWLPKQNGRIKINNKGDLSQIRKLRQGFQYLQKGAAQNPNLEYLLFDEKPPSPSSEDRIKLSLTDTLQNELNTYQQKAVEGALNANDLYLIQGPPGTGKTTVIAELCYQNAIRGLRTFVASQSGFAVDNALNKLIKHPSIRILRKGNTNRINEEGQKFIEENVASTWHDQTIQFVDEDITHLKATLSQYRTDLEAIENRIVLHVSHLQMMDDLERMQETLIPLEVRFKDASTRYTKLSDIQNILLQQQKTLQEKLLVSKQELQDLIKEETLLTDKELRLERLVLHDRKERNLNIQLEQLYHLDELKKQSTKLTQQLLLLSESMQQSAEHPTNRLNKKMSIDQLIAHTGDLVPFIPQALHEKELLLKKARLKKVHRQVSSDDNFSTNQIEKWKIEMRLLQASLSRTLQDHDIVLAEPNQSIEPADVDWTVSQYNQYTRVIRMYLHDFKSPGTVEKLRCKFLKKYPTSLKRCIHYHQELSSHLKTFELLQVDNLNEAHLQSLQKDYEQDVHTMLENFYKQRQKHIEEEMSQKEVHLHSVKKLMQESSFDSLKDTSVYEIELSILRVRKEKEVLLDVDKMRQLHLEKQDALKTQIDLTQYELNQIEAKMTGQQEQLRMAQSEHETHRTVYENHMKQLVSMEHTLGGRNREDLHSQITYEKKKIPELRMTVEKIEQDLELKEIWNGLLQDAGAHDFEEIRRLYIRHANVIGTTCVQSATPEFMNLYPDFDVVIIDEVSKATPPELLLPMLKGKKIILVGDHRQLPPLIGSETLNEAVASLPSVQQQNEAKEILKESLFERLFNTSPISNKQTLRIQYRMHESIMDTISPFYEKDTEEGAIGLSCGLKNSDQERDHFLEGRYVRRGQHLMWFDTPYEAAYFESKETGSTTIFNEGELRIVRGLILDLEQAVIKAKKENLMLSTAKKEIGIISFYKEQIRQIERFVDDFETEHLKFRIGTVDHFQGMESDVIIASFVRNNQTGDIGFLKDYRRLNVALSRAKELLLITGNTTTLTKRSESAQLFSELIRTVKRQNGMRDHEGRVKQ